MKQEIHTPISVLDPVGKAIEEVKVILFRPFDLKKWFIVGFCAWLAYLKSSGGPYGNINGAGYDGLQNSGIIAKEYIGQICNNLFWIIPVGCFAVIAIILLWLVLTWLSSRGHFMFLHCVAKNKAHVQVPWAKYKEHGNNLFLFRILLGIVFFGAIGLCVVMIVLCAIAMEKGVGGAMAIGGLTTGISAAVLFSIIYTLIKKFTFDFVVPIMSLRTTRCTAGWREFLHLLSARKGAFILYLLFNVVILIAFGAIVITAVLLTCCCAGLILAIPYIGVVFMLPLLVFKRAYSLHYLSQFSPDYDVFANRIEPSEGSVHNATA